MSLEEEGRARIRCCCFGVEGETREGVIEWRAGMENCFGISHSYLTRRD